MNATLAISQGLGKLRIGEVLASLGLPSKHAADQQFAGRVVDAIRSISGILDQLTQGVIEKRTSKDFRVAMDEAFPIYARVMLGLSGIVTSIVPPDALERVAIESFSELEADFRDHALTAFGSDLRDQAIFTVWTLRKINDLIKKVSDTPTAEHLKEKDGEFASEFVFHALRARFSLDCLTTSIHSQRAIYPDVLGEISNGLKSVVNAYAWLKQGVDLRMATEEPTLEPVAWDEEDQALLNASMHDLALEFE